MKTKKTLSFEKEKKDYYSRCLEEEQNCCNWTVDKIGFNVSSSYLRNRYNIPISKKLKSFLHRKKLRHYKKNRVHKKIENKKWKRFFLWCASQEDLIKQKILKSDEHKDCRKQVELFNNEICNQIYRNILYFTVHTLWKTS